MEYAVTAWPGDPETLALDHRQFGYAGKFRDDRTGIAVARETDTIIAAAGFNADRTDPRCGRVRTITVRRDRQAEGIGSRLLAGVRVTLLDRRYDRLRIAVNNPYAYEAAYRAGFGFTGETSGLAELVLEAPWDGPHSAYDEGLAVAADRQDLDEGLTEYVATKRQRGPPPLVDPPTVTVEARTG